MNELEQLLLDAEQAISRLAAQKQREIEFAEKSKLTFEGNLLAFEQFYPDIAAAIRGHKPADNFKILVSETGYGNYIPKGATIPLYGDDPIETVKTQVEKNVKHGYYSLTNYGFGQHSSDPRIHVQFMNKLDAVIKQCNDESAELLKELPEHFPSAMIFGIGLGYPITMLLEQHSFDYMFICEPDFELFYASLFCTDWAAIFSKIDNVGHSLFIQVGVSYQDYL